MLNRAEIKYMAREQIRGNIGMLFVCALIMSAIISASGFLIVGPILLAGPMAAGYLMLYLGMSQRIRPQLDVLFSGFQNFVKFFVLYLVIGLFTFLWSLLLFVPGVIKAYSYSFAPYILIDNPGMEPMEALRRSEAMTYGHKMELFMLDLSFIPWILLMMITFGLAGIYVYPYMTAARTNAYLKVKFDNPGMAR